MEHRFIKKMAIVGGGTAGWIAAAALAKALHNRGIEIVLVESPDIGIVGVGESIIPPVISFLKRLGIDEIDFVRETQASYKLGNKFTDWNVKGDSYWHPFGKIGVDIDDRDFFAFIQKARQLGDTTELWRYSPSAVIAEAGRYYSPAAAQPDSLLAGADYAVHLDATLVAKYLRNYCEQRGVERRAATVTDASLTENGFIEALILDDKTRLQADFFLDCSGTAALLTGKVLNTPYLNWNNYLACNSAVIAHSQNQGGMPPFTQITARDNGWSWEIPLRHRIGNGFVYCDEFCDSASAEKQLLSFIQDSPISELKHFNFNPGKREKLWYKNCLALGFAAGFLEPLESTAIYLSAKGIETFISLFPDTSCSPALAQEYNRCMTSEYEHIRDFLVLHYALSNRSDTPFWQKIKTLDVPRTLLEKIALYQAQGRIYRNDADVFKPQSWHALFDGMGLIPEFYDPLIESADFNEVQNIFGQVRELMSKMANGLPRHADFLAKHCPI